MGNLKEEKIMKNNDITLYYYPGTRATKVKWMLEELGVNYQTNLIDLPKGKHKTKTYSSIHPLQKVPALQINRITLFESQAICLYLADYYSYLKMAPQLTSPTRSQYYQWIALATNSLEPALIEQIKAKRAQDLGIELLDIGAAEISFEKVMAYIEKMLKNKQFLIGEGFTTADLILASVLIWADKSNLLSEYVKTKTWLQNILQRPAFVRAVK